MPSKNPTTVVWTRKAQEIKDRLAPAFGLKNILSAGLQLFDALSDSEKIKLAAEVKNSMASKKQLSAKKSLQDAIKIVKESIDLESKQPGTVIEILGKKERAEFEQLCKLLGPEPEKPQKKAKKA